MPSYRDYSFGIEKFKAINIGGKKRNKRKSKISRASKKRNR